MEQRPKLLLADLDEGMRRLCGKVAAGLECELVVATTGDSVLSALKHHEVALVLLDARTIRSDLDLLREIKKKSARMEVTMMDERATIAAAIAAIKAGAFDYLEKPLTEQALEATVTASLERYRLFQPSVMSFEEMERLAIENAIAQAEGDKLEAARLLSIGKTTLYRKLREYGGNSKHWPRRNAQGQPEH